MGTTAKGATIASLVEPAAPKNAEPGRRISGRDLGQARQ